MAAESAVAESKKFDLAFAAKSASTSSGTGIQKSFDAKPYSPPGVTPYEDVQSRIERLQKTIAEIQAVARQVAAEPAPAVTKPVAANATSATGPIKMASNAQGNKPAAPSSFRPRVMPRPANTTSPNASPVRKVTEAAKNSTAYARANTHNQNTSQATAKASLPVAMADVKKWKKQYAFPKMNIPNWYKSLPDIGITATGAWLAGAVIYLGGEVGWNNVINMPAHHLGSIVAGIAAPIALIWMGINHLNRQREIQDQMAPLLYQIDQLVNPNKQVEARIDAVADALRRQANELISATQQVEKTLGNVREGLRTDMEKMMEYAGLTGKHLEQTSAAMANRTSQLARLTEQMHGRLVSFEEHAISGSDRIDQSVSDMMTKAQSATDKLERQANNIVAALHAANMRMTRTADDLDSRISQIGNFADQTAARFGGVASEFGKQGAVVDAATQNIEEQVTRMKAALTMHSITFTQQLSEMGEAVRSFASIGMELSGAVGNFRNAAEQVVAEAAAQIELYTDSTQRRLEGIVKSYTDAMDTRLQQSQSTMDRSMSTTISKVGSIDRTMAERMLEMQKALVAAADETPRIIKEILDETTRRLQDMDMRFTHSGAQVAEHLGDLDRTLSTRLQSMAALADRMGEDAGDAMKQSMVSVFGELQEIKDQFSVHAQGTSRELKTFHNDLSQTIEALGHVARRATDRTVERILMLNAGISQRIMDLRDTAENAHHQGQQLESSLVQHIGLMRNANDQMMQSASRMGETGAAIASDLRDATGQAIAQAEVMSHIIGREADLLRNTSAAAAASMDDAGSTLEMARSELYASVAKSAAQIADMARDLDQQRALYEDVNNRSANTHGAMYQEISHLREAAHALNNQMSSTVVMADERAKDLRDMTTRLGEVTMGIKATMQSGQRELTESTEILASLTNATHDLLSSKSDQLAEVSAQIALNSFSIKSSLEAQQDALERNVTTSATALNHIVRNLENAAATVGIASETSAREIDWLTSHLNTAGDAIDQIGARTSDAMKSAREALTLSEASLQRSASSARVSLNELAQRYESEGSRLASASDDVGQSYGNALNRLERLSHELAGQSFVTFDTLSELGSLFDARIAQLRDGSTTASGELQRVANQLQSNYASLTSGAETAARQLAEIQTSLQSTQSGIDMSSDHAAMRVEALRRELGAYAQDLMMMVSQASGQIESAATSFGAKAEAVRHAANENASLMGETGSRVRAEIEQLARTVHEATADQAGSLSVAVDRLRKQAEELTRQTQQSLIDLERQGVRAAQGAQQIGLGIDQASQRIQNATEQLNRQGEVVANAGTEVAKRIDTAAQVMQTQTEAMRAAAERATSVMTSAGNQVLGQANQWQVSAQNAQNQMVKLIESLMQQFAQIERANVQADETVQRLTQAESRTRRDAFLNAAKYMIESLNSLSIDLTRVLDPKEAERTWKEFAAGDASAFTKRFAAMREDLPGQKLREKYENDHDFRTYAARYFRQFEELFEQAIANDHNDLLATTLTTSDVGKLYTYLAGALGHSKLKAKAA